MALVVDTGPLLAAMDRHDRHHAACRDLLAATIETLVLPAPVLVEMDYWLSTRVKAPAAFTRLLADIEAGAFVVADLLPGDYTRVRELCDRYADADIGFVDAAVLAIVERLNEPKLATIDHRHFHTVRPLHVDALTLLPGRGD